VHRLDLEGLAELLGRDERSGVALETGWPPPFCPEGGRGRRRLAFTAGGSDEGGFEELVEFRSSRCSNSAIRFSKAAIMSRMAAWASGGTVFQSDSGIDG
jgi:hypothetical protein